jgi:DNA-binding HxlR family transcriptional regulator
MAATGRSKIEATARRNGDSARNGGSTKKAAKSGRRAAAGSASARRAKDLDGLEPDEAQPILRREHREWSPLGRALAATGDHWTLVVVLQLSHGPMRLTELRERLPGISAGVLNRQLQHMVSLGVIKRHRYRELPPRVEFELTPCGLELVPVASALTRWGMRHLWSAPQARELVDLVTLMRLVPAMVEGAPLRGGIVELIIELPGQPTGFVFEIDGGIMRLIKPGPGIVPWSRISGDPDAWVETLVEPPSSRPALRVTGDRQLAERLLGALAPVAPGGP